MASATTDDCIKQCLKEAVDDCLKEVSELIKQRPGAPWPLIRFCAWFESGVNDKDVLALPLLSKVEDYGLGYDFHELRYKLTPLCHNGNDALLKITIGDLFPNGNATAIDFKYKVIELKEINNATEKALKIFSEFVFEKSGDECDLRNAIENLIQTVRQKKEGENSSIGEQQKTH